METVISNAGNDSSPPGNGKLMYTINFCPPGELAYVRFILCGRYFDLQPICNSICNAPTIYQLVHYTRLVAGGRCFYVFQLYSRGLRIKIRVTTVSHKTDSPLCPPLDLHCEK